MMKGLSLPGLPQWTCRRCIQNQRTAKAPSSQFTTSSPEEVRGYATRTRVKPSTALSFREGFALGRRVGRNRNFQATIVGLGVIGGAGYYYKDEIRHAVGAVQRTSRVAVALFLNINDYRKTLNYNETIDDEKERTILLKACHQRCADRTMKVLERNGSIFTKLGQHLSAMNYLLPIEWTSTFIPLQDKCPISSFESIEAMFLKDTGHPISEYFTKFEQLPIGAASLAQVHMATLKETGQKVAVKVQHPSLGEWTNLDLFLTRFTFSTLKRFFPEYDLEWLSSEMDESLPQELNFTEEARHALRAKEYFSHLPELPLVIPDVVWARERILVMEYISGHRPDDLEFLDSAGIDRDEVSAALARVFNEMIFGKDAPLHCDPHGGNIAIRKNDKRKGGNFDIILYDHGLYRDIPLSLRRSYAKLWLAVLDANEPRMRKYAYEVAGITDEQFPLFASAITGRAYNVVSTSLAQPRTGDEKEHISQALGEGMLQQLVDMLGKVPRIILLILKTNDLTRSLDEGLKTRQGPVRTFLILARYCARTVYEESVEGIKGSVLWPSNLRVFLRAWFGYAVVEVKLEAFEKWLAFKRLAGME